MSSSSAGLPPSLLTSTNEVVEAVVGRVAEQARVYSVAAFRDPVQQLFDQGLRLDLEDVLQVRLQDAASECSSKSAFQTGSREGALPRAPPPSPSLAGIF